MEIQRKKIKKIAELEKIVTSERRKIKQFHVIQFKKIPYPSPRFVSFKKYLNVMHFFLVVSFILD